MTTKNPFLNSTTDGLANSMMDLRAKADRMEAELMKRWSKEVERLLEGGHFDLALRWVLGLPDCVSRVFLIDRVRNARGDFKKED